MYNGSTKKPTDGKLKVTLKSGATIKLITTAEGEDNISAKVYLPGSKKTPHQIEVNESFSFDVEVAENGAVYYSFVADKDGTVRVTSESEYAYITINGNKDKKSVKNGDTVVMCFSSQKTSGSVTEHPAVTISAELTFAQTTADYNVTVLL